MTVIVSTEAQVELIDPASCETYPAISAVALTKGQLVYLNSSGKYALADGASATTMKMMGVCLSTVDANRPITILKRGHMYGYTVSGMAYTALVYVSDTDGAADTAAGTVSRVIGSIVPKTDPSLTKVVYFDFDWKV